MKISIAIDGPSATGKSTIAKLLANHFHFTHIDTGAMYRCVCYYVLKNSIDIEDELAIASVVPSLQIELFEDRVRLNGNDVTNEIRAVEVSKLTPTIAKYASVREALVAYQRALSKQENCIMDGRDIGSIVLPDATLKFYLDASVEARAKRRYDELIGKGIDVEYASIFKDVEQRDYEDMNRTVAPLIKVEDAIYVDTSNMNIEETLQVLKQKIEEVINRKEHLV